MAALVLAEHNNASLDEATAKTVTAAAQISRPVHVLVAGADCASVAGQAAKLCGVEKVLLADDALYANFLAEPMAELVLSRAAPYEAILAPATANGKNILPRVAAKLDVPQISGNSWRRDRAISFAGRSMPATPSRKSKPRVSRKSSRFESPLLPQRHRAATQ